MFFVLYNTQSIHVLFKIWHLTSIYFKFKLYFHIICIGLWTTITVGYLSSSYLCCSWSYFNDVSFLGFPTHWAQEEDSQWRCCYESPHLCIPCCSPCRCPLPFATLCLSTDCQPTVWQVCACSLPWTKHKYSKQKKRFIATSIIHTHICAHTHW